MDQKYVQTDRTDPLSLQRSPKRLKGAAAQTVQHGDVLRDKIVPVLLLPGLVVHDLLPGRRAPEGDRWARRWRPDDPGPGALMKL